MKVAMKKKTFDALTLFAIIIALSLLGSLAGIAWYRMTLMTDAALKKEHVNESIIWLETLKTGLNHLHGEQSDSVTADQESRDATDLGAIERKLAEVEKLSDDGVGRRSGIQRLQQFIRSTILTPQPWPRQTIPDGEPTGTSHRTSLLSQAIALVDNNIGAEQNFLLQLKQADQRQKLNTRIAFLSVLVLLAIFSIFALMKIRNIANSRTQSYRRLEDSERRYRQIVETAYEGIWMIDTNGRTEFANQRLADMLGYPLSEIQTALYFDFMGDVARAEAATLIIDCKKGVSAVRDFRFRHRDGSDLWVIVSSRPLMDAQGNFMGALGMLTDITQRKRAEGELAKAHILLEERIAQRTAELVAANTSLHSEVVAREMSERALATSEDKFSEVLAMMPLSVFLKDASLNIVLMNEACEQQWGVSLSEIRGSDGSAFFPPEQMSRFFADDRTAFNGKKMVMVEGLVWNCTLQENRLVQTFKKPVYDAQGQPQYLIGASIDITESRRTEDALQLSFLQLRKLTEHQEDIKENERQRIARDIHDELGQNLLALKIDIELMHARIGTDDARLSIKFTTALATIDASIRSVRTIINDLHPSTLALGLCPAVEWLLNNFEQRTAVTGTLRVTGDETDINLDNRHTLAIFRIIQESLVNIARHAKASDVQIALGFNAGQLDVVITDNGIGIQPGDRRKSGSFGIKGIQERIEAFGGKFAIDVRGGGGTTLSFSIPLTANLV